MKIRFSIREKLYADVDFLELENVEFDVLSYRAKKYREN